MRKFKLFLVMTLAITMLSGCGWFDRKMAAVSGNLSEVCHDGVMYLQGTSGLTAKLDKNTGGIVTCDN